MKGRLPLILLIILSTSAFAEVPQGTETQRTESERFLWLLPSGAAPAAFPADFPELIDSGGLGKGQRIGGFGGNEALDRTGNRAQIRKIPVVFVHGNGTHAQDEEWGWHRFRDFLKANGYNDSEIWAVSYLGTPSSAQLGSPHQDNIDDVRRFIDAVRAYLDVQKVDLIGHSLGCGMVRAYMLGFQPDGKFDNSDNRLSAIGTLVTLAGGNYGLSQLPLAGDEFVPGSYFETNSHKFNGVVDDTPWGDSSNQTQIIGDCGTSNVAYQGVTELDDDKIHFVALWENLDIVDRQNSKSGRLQGANLNKCYELATDLLGLKGHQAILHSDAVFNDVLPYLNQAVETAYPGYPGPEAASTRARAAPAQPEQATATVPEHYLAGRIDRNQYFAYGRKYGWTSQIALRRAGDTWSEETP